MSGKTVITKSSVTGGNPFSLRMRLVEERSNAQLIEGLVDLGFNIEATAFDFPLDGK